MNFYLVDNSIATYVITPKVLKIVLKCNVSTV